CTFAARNHRGIDAKLTKGRTQMTFLALIGATRLPADSERFTIFQTTNSRVGASRLRSPTEIQDRHLPITSRVEGGDALRIRPSWSWPGGAGNIRGSKRDGPG